MQPEPHSITWFEQIKQSATVSRLAGLIAQAASTSGEAISARGAIGSSTTIVTAAIQQKLARPVVLVCAHLDEADEAVEELESLGIEAVRFPAMELSPGESSVSLDLLAERLTLVRKLIDGQRPSTIIAPVQALMQAVPRADRLSQMLRVIKRGDRVDTVELSRWLSEAGYSRVETIDSPGEFAIRGGIVDVFPPGGAPARLDLFGDEVDAMHEVDLGTMGSDRKIDHVELVGATLQKLQTDEGMVALAEHLPSQTVAVLAELGEITEQGRSYFDRASDSRGIFGPPAVFKSLGEKCHVVVDINQYAVGGGNAGDEAVELPVQALPAFSENATEAFAELAELASEHEVAVMCQNEGEAQRTSELIQEFAPQAKIEIQTRYLHRGFIWAPTAHASDAKSLALVPYHELLHRYHTRRRVRRVAVGAGGLAGGVGTGRAIDSFVDLQPGDYVVHRDHGIARFLGLRALDTEVSPGKQSNEEFLTLEFGGRAKIHVPASKIELVQKYIGAFQGEPKLSTIGGKGWKRQKEQVSEAVRDLAAEMLRIQAARESMPGVRYPADTPWQKEFEAEFPYEETEDQLAAIAAVKRDMNDPRPMDRLICGDVGFGKTEVAIRAAFKSAEFGKQVAILVPTTVLAEQHERTFCERFADYPFRIESISRFKSGGDQKKVLEELRKGQVDIIIGTHRLLSKDVKFADLGLVVIDEEQRFGVEHKHKLLEFRATAHVLTMSATPIPRTLHMSLLGLRDISSLTTAPLDRRAIVTEVISGNKKRMKQAIERELAREGQVFFVHNRVGSIDDVAADLLKLVPGARIIVGHGQMPARQLESVMLKFMRREADILVCTTIIESGIDIPTANTMFINDAQRFGLSELHQLRGRVGRYKHRAYCYLILPRDRVLSEIAMKRLQALENFSMLGAGFKIALRDLEIRGAGNLLGAEQSGHIATVGYEMYCQLLEQAVSDLKNERPTIALESTIDIGISGSIPKGYIPSDARRMDAYRRISRANDLQTLQQIEHDLVSAYGELPRSAKVHIHLAEIQVAAATLNIMSITRHENDIIFRTKRPGDLERHMKNAKGSLRIVGQPDSQGVTEVYYRPPPTYFEDDTLLNVLRKRLQPSEMTQDTVMEKQREPIGVRGERVTG
jgi:transcription-repair coupling factor (superfamily II helicase)